MPAVPAFRPGVQAAVRPTGPMPNCQAEFPGSSLTRSPGRDRRRLSASQRQWVAPGSSGSPRGGGESWPGATTGVGPEPDLDADDTERMAVTAARGALADLPEGNAAPPGPRAALPDLPTVPRRMTPAPD